MIPPNPVRQKSAWKKLDELFKNSDNVNVIHYSCESFYDFNEGRSPRITSIALRNLSSAQTRSFSIHLTAETCDIDLEEVENHYDQLEKEMLRRFFDYIAQFQSDVYLHWNMRDSNYGFQAIEHRFRSLFQSEDGLHIVDDKKKTDLSRLLKDIYGLDYIDHPRLEQLVTKNNIVRRDFLTGSEEAQAFVNRDFVSLHRSTLRKVDIIGNIALLTHDRRLQTNTTWWGMRGGSLTTFIYRFGEHPLLAVFCFLVALFSIAFTSIEIISDLIP